MKFEDVWTPVDPLSEALQILRMSGTFYSRAELSAPWGATLPELKDSMMFHFVTSGVCKLEIKGEKSSLLRAGDLVLLPHGEGHQLSSGRTPMRQKFFDLPREMVSERYEILRSAGGGAASSLICAVVRFDHPAARHLIKHLPRLIHIAAASSPHMDWINSMLRFMAAEAGELRPGGEAVITRLADIMVIQTLRAWIARNPTGQTGWFGALQHPQIGRALALVHRDSARAWTLELLAGEVGMSRSAFAARFTEVVGESTMQYVARWRMHLAFTWLKEGDASVANLADRLGYESEAAFSRAFKRLMGVSPGSVRRKKSDRSKP